MGKNSIKRNNITLRRKNFLPLLSLTVILWVLLIALVYFTDPVKSVFIYVFFFITFFALFFTFSLILVNKRRGVLTAAGLTIFLILRYFGIGNLLNLLLITGIFISLELYYLRH